MSTGQVKWFNNAKGFGFILPDDGGDDLFAHYSSISMEGYKTLKAGQSVSFDVIEGPKGLHAANIVPLDEGSNERQCSIRKQLPLVSRKAAKKTSNRGKLQKTILPPMPEHSRLTMQRVNQFCFS